MKTTVLAGKLSFGKKLVVAGRVSFGWKTGFLADNVSFGGNISYTCFSLVFLYNMLLCAFSVQRLDTDYVQGMFGLGLVMFGF